MLRSKLVPLALLGCLIIGLGCTTGNNAAPARVSGSLAYNGQPIKAALMKFHTPEGVAYAAQVSADGTYSATDIPVGELIVTIETDSFNPANKPGDGSEADRRA